MSHDRLHLLKIHNFYELAHRNQILTLTSLLGRKKPLLKMVEREQLVSMGEQ